MKICRKMNLEKRARTILAFALVLAFSAQAGDVASTRAAGIRPLRIVPNKIVYSVGEKGWADIAFTNASAKAERAPYVVTDSWDVDGSSREISRGEIELAPRAGKTVRVVWPGSSVRYGHEVKVKILGQGQGQGQGEGEGQEWTRSEYFAVNTDWWRVAQGCGLDTYYEKLTPLFRQFMEYYGLPVRPPKCTAGYRLWMDATKREGFGMGAFPGYQTLLTRWQMQLCSVGGNKAAADMPDGKTWYSCTEVTESRDSGRIREDTRVSHENGVHHTRYTIGSMEGPFGFEVARRHPEYLLHTDRGQPVGHYQGEKVDPVWISEIGNGRQCTWTFLRPDFSRDDTVEWAVRDLAAGIDGFGEDGVYWDGCYLSGIGYDCEGRLVSDPKDKAKWEARYRHLIGRWHELIMKDRPDRFAWMNGVGLNVKNNFSEPDILKRSGGLLEYQWSFMLGSHPSNTYRGQLDEMRLMRDRLFLPSADGATPSKVYFVGYLVPGWQPRPKDDPGQYREVWTMAQHVMSIIASQLAHPFAGGPQMRNFKQMMMRYSQFYWHEDIEVMQDGYKRFLCEAEREVWYDDMIYRRETKEYTEYCIHLVNAPESERCRENVVADPPTVNDAVISTKLFGAEGVKAWAIQPYAYLDPVLEPKQVSVPVQSQNGETIVKVPPFNYYTLVVMRVPKGKAKPGGLEGAKRLFAKMYPDNRIGGNILRHGNRLYVVGGINVCGVQQISRIDLDPDGWPVAVNFGATIAREVSYTSAAISGRWLYVTGGALKKGSTIRFEIRPDGSLANRTELESDTLPVCNMSGMVASGSYLIVAGGWQTRAVYMAKVNADGSLGSWTRQHPLPSNCFTQGRIFRLGRRLFAAGNPGYKKATDRVFASEVAADGAVTKWRRWAELPEAAVDFDFQPLADGSGFYYRSGETGAQYVAPLVGDGEVGRWRRLETAFPGGPFTTQVGIPLPCGRYLRFAACKGTPNGIEYLKPELVEMQ